MKVVFIWLTMGEYHIARMKAISRLIGQDNFSVINVASMDDHKWNLNLQDVDFKIYTCIDNEELNRNSLKKAAKKIDLYLTQINADIIVNGCGYFDINLFKILKKRNEKKIIWSESTLLDNPQDLLKNILKIYLNSIYDGAMVAGTAHKKMMTKLGYKKRPVRIVGNVVENEKFSNYQYNNSDSFIFVGRLLSIKNVHTLLRSFKKVSDKTPTSTLTIVGDGIEMTNLKKLANELSLNDIVKFTGLIQPSELIHLYHQHSIHILPSISEPWGLVVNEAMASGLINIVSNRCGSAEMIQHGVNGFLFDPKSVKSLSEIMIDVLNQKNKWDSFRANGFEVIKNYTPQKYAKRVVELFYEI